VHTPTHPHTDTHIPTQPYTPYTHTHANRRFTIRTLSRLTLSITVTETVLKAHGSLWLQTETMEIERGSHEDMIHPPFSTLYILRQKRLLSLLSYLWHYNTSLQLTITEHTLYRTVEKTFDVKISSHHGTPLWLNAHTIALITFGIP